MSQWTPPKIVGCSELPSDELLFDELGLTLSSSLATSDWALTRSSNEEPALSLIRPDGVSLSIDFTSGKARHRTTESGMGAQSLVKATGVKTYLKQHGQYPRIIDATGGLGQDAWALASVGCDLTIIEHHPVVHALLNDALQRALLDAQTGQIAARIRLVKQDSSQWLETEKIDAHAVYLDPMYPAMRKKASSKKGMQFLHDLLGPPPEIESDALLLAALNSGASRVAVKRPVGAPLLAGSSRFNGQRTEISTPNTRYDIYHCSS